MKRLAIITTHPIQYNAPLFHLLNERNKISIKVFYTWGKEVLSNKFDPGFRKTIKWDIPLLDGYQFKFVKNISKQPGSHHFKGIDNPTLINEIEDWAPDSILIFGWNFKSHLKALRYFHNKIPVIFRGDSTLLDRERGIKKLVKRRILNWVFSYVDTALYVGKENKKYFEYAGMKESQLVFAPHAVDNNRFRFDAKAGQKIRFSLNIPGNAIVFLFAGKLEPKKNPQILLKAFNGLQNENAHLIIAGNGILEDTLRKTYSSNHRIHFIPFQNQTRMPGLYSACDIFVLPSQGPGETWGLSVNEAMACSRAVLVSNKCGCCSDLVINGENGFIFQSRNEIDLAKKMKYLMDNKNKMESMKVQSMSMIKPWCYENICESIEASVNRNT